MNFKSTVRRSYNLNQRISELPTQALPEFLEILKVLNKKGDKEYIYRETIVVEKNIIEEYGTLCDKNEKVLYRQLYSANGKKQYVPNDVMLLFKKFMSEQFKYRFPDKVEMPNKANRSSLINRIKKMFSGNIFDTFA